MDLALTMSSSDMMSRSSGSGSSSFSTNPSSSASAVGMVPSPSQNPSQSIAIQMVSASSTSTSSMSHDHASSSSGSSMASSSSSSSGSDALNLMQVSKRIKLSGLDTKMGHSIALGGHSLHTHLSHMIGSGTDKLERRLGGILCCAVCMDLPKNAVFQCTNGHLMCSACFTHLLADARLRDETASCPSCRCLMTRDICSRNLAVEKAVSELPGTCKFCEKELPRVLLTMHQEDTCEERIVRCGFNRIGCPWRGPFHELENHEETCPHPNQSGRQILGALEVMDRHMKEERKAYESVLDLLSYEKLAFQDLQLKGYRTEEFIHRLYYETTRFSAFNYQWVVKARVNENDKDPSQVCERRLSYQLVLKSKPSAPISIHYMVLKGPNGDMKISPKVYRHDFSESQMEGPYTLLPLTDSAECNKLLASKVISLRLLMFQMPK